MEVIAVPGKKWPTNYPLTPARRRGLNRFNPSAGEAPPPDLGEGFPEVARQAIDIGEQALKDLRARTVERWISVGGALAALRNVAMHRSGANTPTGQRYNRAYAVLAYRWPRLLKLDKATRSHAIWLFSNSDFVLPWVATLPQNQRDQWTHPAVIRRHYTKRHPNMLPSKSANQKPRPPTRTKREWNRQPLGERTREDLEVMVAGLADSLSDRDREIAELNATIEEKDREIKQLREDLAWEVAAKKAGR
jgi:hypothetical protein